MNSYAFSCLLVSTTLVALAPVGVAAQPAGVVLSAGPITLGDTVVAAAGVIGWTVLNGDEIFSASDPALVILRNGARIVLEAGSRVKVESSKITVREGRVFLSCRRECRLSVAALDQSVSMSGGSSRGVLVKKGNVSWTSGGAMPVFALSATQLLERLPYTAGVHLSPSP